MKGNITQRGKQSWRLKLDVGRDASGKRKISYQTFHGSKREAQRRLAELIASVSANTFVEPSKVSIIDSVRSRIDLWEAAGDITARTAVRYRFLADNQIAPHIGSVLLQKLRPVDVERWHTTLRTNGKAHGRGPLSARTIGHAHRLYVSGFE